MSKLCPTKENANKIFRKIVAFQGFPKTKFSFFDIPCIILEAHILAPNESALLTISCRGGGKIAVDKLQPENRKPMDAKSFINGYGKRSN